MRKARCGKFLGWRWRDNPLRRRSDVLEAWIVLASWALATVVAACAGLLGAQLSERAAERDRAGREPVSAVLVRILPGGAPDTVSGVRYDRALAIVRWRDANGTGRTGTMEVTPTARAGSGVRAWSDGHGRLLHKPVGPAEATTRAVLAGTSAGLAAGLTALAGGRLVRLRVQRRATEAWGAAWERIDGRWGHTAG
ncbi:Rv1733c family protein [Streptomyces sp. NPDC001102]